MNALAAFSVDLVTTLLVGLLLVAYLRRPLRKVLVELCGTDDRANFWTKFSAVLLLGLPVASALAYDPLAGSAATMYSGIPGQLSRNLMTFLLAMIAIGLVVSFFALVAPRSPKERSS